MGNRTGLTRHEPGSQGFYDAELNFGTKFGIPTIESDGDVKLYQDESGLVYANNSTQSYYNPVKLYNEHVGNKTFKNYTFIAAETFNSKNQVALRHPNGSI